MTISLLKKSENRLEGITEDLINTSSQTAKTAMTLTEVSKELEEKSEAQKQTSQQITVTTNELADFLETQIGNANASVAELQGLMEGIWQGFERSKTTSALIKKIEKATRIISKVAKKTEVLAMNAGIQASQAGEYGKGFHVISQEIKKLATMCQEAASDIEISVDQAITSAQGIANENEKIQHDSMEKSEAIVKVFRDIINFHHATDDQTPNTRKINKLIATADDIAHNVDRIASDVKDTSVDLSKQVEDTNRVVSDIIGCVYNREIVDLVPRDAFLKLQEFEIIDVRREDEFYGDLGRIEGSRLITINDEFAAQISSLPRDQAYLFVCRSGGRSARAARIAQMNGFTKVFNLNGGMLKWQEESLPAVGDLKKAG